MVKYIAVVLVSVLSALSALSAIAEPSEVRSPLPILGWSSWNHFQLNINEKIVREQADAMVASGMQAAGYEYINIDDGYFGGRSQDGVLQFHPAKFPNGMRAVSDYIHAKGLKAGIYTDA